MNKLKRKKISKIVNLTIIASLLGASLAFLTLALLVPKEHTIEYKLIFDNPVLLQAGEAINPDSNPDYYVEETYEDIKNRNSSIYVCTIEGSFESEGTLGGKEEEVYNQIYLFYLGEDELIHYVKYEAHSRYDMKIEMNSTYLKITFKGAKI